MKDKSVISLKTMKLRSEKKEDIDIGNTSPRSLVTPPLQQSSPPAGGCSPGSLSLSPAQLLMIPGDFNSLASNPPGPYIMPATPPGILCSPLHPGSLVIL